MLRNRLFKRFGNGGGNDLNPKPTNLANPQLTDSTDTAGELLNLPGFIASPQEMWDWQNKVNPKIDASKLDVNSFLTLSSDQVPTEDQKTSKANELTKNVDTGSLEKNFFDQFKGQEGDLVTLGLAGISTALGYNQDLENQRKRNESIQQRNSKPLYDYNYMYGRTTSGGTEYQPTIKAEMGAKINKRYASEGANNVEVEGGEFIQLPNLDTEIASGSSHDNGGIPTNLPNQTRVYSNNLKPEGSKKTFAQLAKNYDISSYEKTLDNPFSKQVDKDTANIMMQRNQRILDDLFKEQQALNGNSNGELEAKNGAGINNPGFRALPQNVQDKILAEMQYGGLSRREAASLEMVDGSEVKDPIPTYSPGTRSKIAQLDPKLQLLQAEVPGLQPTLQSGVYGQESNLDLFRKNFDWFLKDVEAQGQTFDPKNTEQMRMAQVAYNEELKSRAIKAGYTPEEADKLASEMGFVPEAGSQRSIDSKLGLYTASRQLPTFEPKGTVAPVAEAKPAMDLLDVTPPTQKNFVANEPITGATFQGVTAKEKAKYTGGKFPLYQAIPEAMGLAQSQEIYSYGIPEINAPYVRPQTLNIQSQLQDIDSMATAAQRAGGDPLSTYIAGLDAKQKAFQAKQNYDAEGRSRADMANAQMKLSADQMNAQYFDRVYNNLVGQARDAQSAEKQAAVASLVNKKAKYTQDETKKAAFLNALMENFDTTSTGEFVLKPGKNPIVNTNVTTKAKKGMYKK